MKSGLFGVALSAALVFAPAAFASSAELEGNWDNERPSAGGLAELDLAFDGATFSVRAAATCSPRPCDLGGATGFALLPPGRRNVARDVVGISAGFEGGDASRQVIATVAGRDRLQVVMIQSYRDGRPATITTETFRRADRDDGVAAECVAAGRLRIRFDGGEWTIAGDPGTLAAFDSPEEAGLARYLLQAQGLTTYCAIEDGGFSYWTKADGTLPRGAAMGEYCTALGSISVRRQGRVWQVQSGRATLYESEDRAVADAIAATLIDTRAAAQCFVGTPGRGLTYFRR